MFDYQKCIDYLKSCGADKKKHSARTLLIHLERTFRILEASGQPEHICFAGLMHSVYGTSIFKNPTVPIEDRKVVSDLIGARSENLVWLFCRLDRPESLRKFAEGSRQLSIHNSAETWNLDETEIQSANELLIIEAANLLDQQTLWQNQWLIPVAKTAGLLTSDGFCVLRISDKYTESRSQEFHRMLDAARQGARANLIQRINSFRIEHSSLLIGGEDLRKLKLHQALLYSKAKIAGTHDSLPLEKISLLSNFANSYNRTLDEAVEVIYSACSKFEAVLCDSELLKDKFLGKLAMAETLSEIDKIRKEINELTF